MSGTRRHIQIQLSDGQVAQVVQEAGDGGIKAMLFARLDEGGVSKSLIELLDDPLMRIPGISRSVVIGWVVLAAFTPPGVARAVIEVARELKMSLSTTHRYVKTLAELTLLEKTVLGRYQIAVVDAKKLDNEPTP